MKKHLLVHSLIFPPDQVSTAYIYGDIVEAFIQSNWEVTVITTYPHFNYDQKFDEISERKLFYRKTNYKGADVYHVAQKKPRAVWKRALYILLFHGFFVFKSLTIRRFHVVLSPSPPLSAGFLSGIIARMRRAKAVYNVQEIYPDILIKTGQIKSTLLLWGLKRLEKATYTVNEKVVAIDERFVDTLASRVSSKKLHMIPNFVDTELYRPYVGEYSPELMFEGKFLVGYVGNVGHAQDWDVLFKAAKQLEQNPDLVFLIVGGGTLWEEVCRRSKTTSNVIVWPYQKRELIPVVNSRIDVHFINMNRASDNEGLPSKVFTILSCGKPIVALTSDSSPLSSVIKASKNGFLVNIGDSDGFVREVLDLKNRGTTGQAAQLGRQFVVDNYSKEAVTRKYVALLESLL